MSNASLMTWTADGLAAQQSTDNAVLAAALGLGTSCIITSAGDMAITSGGTIFGGANNTSSNTVNNSSVWSGNSNNTFDSRSTFIGAGANNRTSGNESAVGGGYNNDALNDSSVVAGGKDNTANNPNATVVGGIACVASANCTVACGNTANATGDHAICFGDQSKSSNTSTAAFGGLSANVTGNYSQAIGGYQPTSTGTANCVAIGGYVATANSGSAATVVGGYTCVSRNSQSTCVGGKANTCGISGAYSSLVGGESNKANEQSTVLGGWSCNTYGADNVMMGPTNTTNLMSPSFEIGHSSGGARHISRVHNVTTTSSNNGTIGYLVDGLLYTDTCIVGIRDDGSQGCSIRIQGCIRKPSGNAVLCTGRSGFASPVVTVYTRDAATFNASGILSGNTYTIRFNGPTAAGVTYKWAIHSNIAYRAK